MGLASQVVTLVAVLAGAAASYLVTRLSERDRFQRELKVRWDQRRLDSYNEFMAAIKVAGTYANRVIDHRLRGHPDSSFETELETLLASDVRRAEAFESLIMLASGPTIEAGHALNHAVWCLVQAAEESAVLAEDEWHRLADNWVTAMNDFHTAARADLMISGQFSRRDLAALAISRPERGGWAAAPHQGRSTSVG